MASKTSKCLTDEAINRWAGATPEEVAEELDGSYPREAEHFLDCIGCVSRYQIRREELESYPEDPRTRHFD